MSISIAQEAPNSPVGNFGLTQHKLTRHFKVQTTSYAEGPMEVGSAIGIPRLFSIYIFGRERHLYARVREINCERIEPNSLFWNVEVSYSTPQPYDKNGAYREKDGEQDNPIIQIPEVETSFEVYQQPLYWIYDPVTEDIAPCKASNGEVYDPPPIKDASRLHLTITRNEDLLAPHPLTDTIYQDAINSDVFWGCPPGSAKVVSITAQRQTKQLTTGAVFPYLRVSYKFAFRNTWNLSILDSGSYYYDATKDPDKKRKLKFISADGHPLQQGPLDGNGGALAPGDTPLFNQFLVYKKLPFSALNLPNSFSDIA